MLKTDHQRRIEAYEALSDIQARKEQRQPNRATLALNVGIKKLPPIIEPCDNCKFSTQDPCPCDCHNKRSRKPRKDAGMKRKPEVKQVITPEDFMKFKPNGYRLITKFKHVGDYHNFTVICIHNGFYFGMKKYAVWNFNGCKGCEGFYAGSYFHGESAEKEAVAEFNERVRGYGMARTLPAILSAANL